MKEASKSLKIRSIKPNDEAAECLLQEVNIFICEKVQYRHSTTATKTVGHLAKKCDRMLGKEYMRKHNEVNKFIYLPMCDKVILKSSRISEVILYKRLSPT